MRAQRHIEHGAGGKPLGVSVIEIAFEGFTAETAKGAVLSGVMIGGADLVAVNVGDWFAVDGLPGRVTFVDASNPERIELSFRMEQRGV